MKYLVTGGAGFIGSHIVARLVEEGKDVTVVDNLSTGNIDNLTPWLNDIIFVEDDIRNERVGRLVFDADYVIHQAALGSVPRSIENPMETHDVNVNGTLNLLEAARHSGVRRFVSASSSSVYGDVQEPAKSESTPLRPISPYAVTKAIGEYYCRSYYKTYGLETISLRYFNVFGPRQNPDGPYAAVIPRFIKAAFDGEPLVVFGDGEQSRDFTFVENVVEANMLSLTTPHCGPSYNVGCGHRITINGLVRLIGKLLPDAQIEVQHVDERLGDVRHSSAILLKSRIGLRYDPKVSLGDGLQQTVEFMLESQHGLEDHW